MSSPASDGKFVHGQWSSRWAFILAATGSAVGLGNIWKFPYLAGENGGGAFVLIYILCVVVIGIPIMVAEVMIGRRGRQSPINTMRTLAKEERASHYWKYLGWMGVLAGFLILSYYSVIAGWTLAYVVRTAAGVFNLATADGVSSIFGQLVSDPEKMLGWHTIFMVITVAVVARGIERGLERAVRILMPALFVLLLALVFYAMGTEQFAKGVEFLFQPDFSKISAGGVLAAMGQAFFSLSLGMGAIMIYGSYLPKEASIASSCAIIAFSDTLVAILAGLVIFPIVFSYGLEPAGGPGLIFKTLPIAFGQMPGGAFWGTLFFLLLVFAAWTSAISLIEPVVAWLVETKGYNRVLSSSLVGILIWLLGIVTILSFNDWAFSFSFGGETKTSGMFDIFDILTSNVMLPLGGILIAVFAGWKMKPSHTRHELDIRRDLAYNSWRFLVRYIAPALVFLVLLNLFGVFDYINSLFA